MLLHATTVKVDEDLKRKSTVKINFAVSKLKAMRGTGSGSGSGCSGPYSQQAWKPYRVRSASACDQAAQVLLEPPQLVEGKVLAEEGGRLLNHTRKTYYWRHNINTIAGS